MKQRLIKKISEVTRSYGYSIYPRIRKMQLRLADHFNMNATEIVVALIEDKHEEIFGEDDGE